MFCLLHAQFSKQRASASGPGAGAQDGLGMKTPIVGGYGGMTPMHGSATPMVGSQTPMAGGMTPMAGGRTPMAGGRTPMPYGEVLRVACVAVMGSTNVVCVHLPCSWLGDTHGGQCYATHGAT